MASVRELLHSIDDIPGDSPSRDLEILLGHCLGKTRTWLYTWPETELEPSAQARFDALLQRRRAGEPVAYLTGHREFWSLLLAVNESTLIPRPETETLVEWALELDLPAAASVLDLGTGTGAIALALASERPAWLVAGLDACEETVSLARSNALANNLSSVQFQQSDWFAAVSAIRYDLLVANPPYIERNDPHLSRGDVRFEPASALVAGEAGLADLRAIVAGAPDHLNKGGWLLLEHGFEQGESVRALLAGRGFSEVSTRADLSGNERISGGIWRAD